MLLNDVPHGQQFEFRSQVRLAPSVGNPPLHGILLHEPAVGGGLRTARAGDAVACGDLSVGPESGRCDAVRHIAGALNGSPPRDCRGPGPIQ